MYQATATHLSTNQNCVDEWVTGHKSKRTPAPTCDHEVPNATIKLRRIGFIDQRGCVWVSSKDWQDAGGPNGSITPLYINPGCD